METDKGFQDAVKKAFGPAILDSNGNIVREKLSDLVFSNPQHRRMINKLSHPRIFKQIIKDMWRLKLVEKCPMVVLDAPTLFETKILQYFCFPIIVVAIEDRQTQVKRLMERT